MPRIALIHALEESVLPVRGAFDRHWPDANLMDLLDTSLSSDLAAKGCLDETIIERFLSLGDYAASAQGEGGQAQAILFTCSAFGPAIAAVKAVQDIPVFTPNEAAFSKALTLGTRLALVVTFPPSLPALTAELQDMADQLGKSIKITPILAQGGMAALKAGNGAAHDQAVLDACAELHEVDVIILGQFSLARAAAPLSQITQYPILTTPDTAVLALRALFVST